MTRVGFIGLGFQGKPLARNIVEAGFAMTVYDVRPEAAVDLAAAGAAVVDSPSAVAQGSDLVILCVVDDQQVMTVLDGPDGVLRSARPGLIVAIHSTILPATVAEAERRAAAHGVIVVDAPVSGSAKGAEERTMSYMVGGPDEAVEVCLPVFLASGSQVTRAGGVGAATVAKIAHQLVCCVNMMAVSEGLKLGVAAGVDRDILLQVFSAGFAQSRAGDLWPELDLHPRATPIFDKDLRAVATLAETLGVATPAAALTRRHLADILPRIEKEA